MDRRLVCVVLVALVCDACGKTMKLIKQGEATELRDVSGPSNPNRPDLLVVALDGVDRDLMYDMLRAGELPGMARLIGGRDASGEFPHAWFGDDVLTVLPSSTFPAWAAAFTGESPSVNGVTGNEMFVRERDELFLGAPTSSKQTRPAIEVFTDGKMNDVLRAPTVYGALRADEPRIVIWVAGSQVYAGADRFLMADRSIVAEELVVWLGSGIDPEKPAIYKQLDEAIAENVVEDLANPVHTTPDVLTVYFPGLDLYAHKAKIDPDRARREYLIDAIDPELGRLARTLAKLDAPRDRWVIIVSDHGHTDVVADEAHALDDEPVSVLTAAGFHVRPFASDVPGDHDAVFAYQGAMAFLSLADRSTCTPRCDWTRPPRFREDVVPAAEALRSAPLLRGKIDLVLTRRPRPQLDDDAPFQVYTGKGRLEPLHDHPRGAYVAFEPRMRELGAGRYGERAGDILLVARFGAERDPARRYYFSPEYESWHGSASRRDSEIPLIVAHPSRRTRDIEAIVKPVLGDHPDITRLTPLMIRLRHDKPR